MKILLPENLELTCTACKVSFVIKSSSVHQVSEINCPICGIRFELIEGFTSKIKRQVYHALRDEIEREVFLRYKQLNPDKTDLWVTDDRNE